MNTATTSTPVSIHTLTTLCNELVSGRAVSVDSKRTLFHLKSKEARSLFNWYRTNQAKWAGHVQKQDVEAMVDQMLKDPPLLPPLDTGAGVKPKRILHLKTMRAHRFAGLHRFGSPETPPADFHFDFGSPLTLIEGDNGAGKTSLLSAITWCLTGHVYRPQRPPETAGQPVPVGLASDGDLLEDNARFTMAPITPMPSAEVLNGLGKEDIPLDTWVELTFVDDAGNCVGSVRRSVSRRPRGKIEIIEPDMSGLGLAPIAMEIGTKMPGLIPYIRLGTACDIGKAVSALTGIKPLEDLVKHAERTKGKLDKDFVKERQAEIVPLDADFVAAHQELLKVMAQHPDIDPTVSIPRPSADRTLEVILDKHAAHFEHLQAQALGASKTILGDIFDPNNPDMRKDLTDSISPALGLLDSAHLKGLASAARLAGLATLDEEALSRAQALQAKLRGQAEDLSRLELEPDAAARLRLYARVLGWMKGLPKLPHDIKECPICQTSLDAKTDPVTKRPITEHLSDCLNKDTEYLEKTLTDWEEDALKDLRAALPEPLQAELGRDLPARPADLISQALAEELFESRLFRGSLLPLKASTKSLCDKVLESLPVFDEPHTVSLPERFGKSPNSLDNALQRLARAIAFARWRRNNQNACKAAFSAIIGQASAKGKQPGCSTEERTLHDKLAELDRTVKNAEPLTSALARIAMMQTKLKKRRDLEDRIALYGQASKAMEPLLELRTLVVKQVSSLVETLSSNTVKWKEGFYSPAFAEAPEVAKADVGADGSLKIQAKADGAVAAADHVSNASDLRATLLAFLLAFWQHLLESCGGLSLLLLDDLQELFDSNNRKRLANSIPSMLDAGGRLVITTNNHHFGRSVIAAMKRTGGSGKVDHRQIHTLNPCREHIELGRFSEEIDSKRKLFEEDVNDHQPARDYVNYLRIYLEERLLDLFEIPIVGLTKEPTLSSLVGALRTRINARHEAFSSDVFGKLSSDPAMKDGSEFLRIMNECHHGNQSSVKYNDVKKVTGDCTRIRELVDSAHEEYDRWMRSDRRDPPRDAPDAPKTLVFPPFHARVVRDLAAFTAEIYASEPAETEEAMTEAILGNHAMYVLNTHNFGFAAGPCTRVLVSTKEEPVPDNSLVIALHDGKIYARRLFRDFSTPNTIALGSDAANPLKRLPSLFLPSGEVRLLQVTGVVFDDSPAPPKRTEEAWPVEASELLGRVQVAFTVRGDSAIPLALPNQVVLGGDSLTPAQIDALEGHLLAVVTTEGAALKRVGQAVPGFRHVRLFESVGGLGESMLIRLEEREDELSHVPLLISAREIIGVLYASTGIV